MEMFALATRKKLRFASIKGHLTVEDLWDLPLKSETGKPNLNDIAKGLYKVMKAEDEISFVETQSEVNTKFDVVKTKFDIVKFVIDTKLAEANAFVQAKEIKEHNQRILELISKKEVDELAGKSVDELKSLMK